MSNPTQALEALAQTYRQRLQIGFGLGQQELELARSSAQLLYGALGLEPTEAEAIEQAYTKGQFLYKYAGRFLEEACKLCFSSAFPHGKSQEIPNTQGKHPEFFEVDWLVDNIAYQFQWRDSMEEEDYVKREHSRLRSLLSQGYKPVRLLFFYPQLYHSKRILDSIVALYQSNGGEYHYGEAAWNYVKTQTEVDLAAILQRLNEGAITL